MFNTIFTIGRLVGILFLVVFIPYLIVTLRKKTGSNDIVSWICAVVGIILIVICLSGINRLALAITGYIVGPLLTALSLKYGRNRWTRFRRKCFVVVLRHKLSRSSLTITWLKPPRKNRKLLPKTIAHSHH